jgi:hypothetical protein
MHVDLKFLDRKKSKGVSLNFFEIVEAIINEQRR